jgi:hypothetical protein
MVKVFDVKSWAPDWSCHGHHDYYGDLDHGDISLGYGYWFGMA